MNKGRFTTEALVSLVALLTFTGCASMEKQMQTVAKDWSMLIRASQVIPVYPLTEDLQPGDIFLVETPIQKQTQQYKEEGFLPLDQHLARLHGLDYGGFYEESYGVDKLPNTPHHWQFPETARARKSDACKPRGDSLGSTLDIEKTDWCLAPRAAFPSYAFEVKKGVGAKLALPVQGVPIGLSFMRTDSAAGAVTIADAYTYGVSLAELQDKVLGWAKQEKNREMLQQIQEIAGHEIYLRVINRVYLTGRVVVSMTNTRTSGAEAKGGAEKTVAIPEASTDAAKGYETMRQKLNEGLEKTLPGGALKVLQGSHRSVTLSETFPRPLVVGYLGFDFSVQKDGSLGAPIATRSGLLGIKRPFEQIREDYVAIRAEIDRLDDPTKADIYEKAAKSLGDEFFGLYEGYKKEEKNPGNAFARAKIRHSVGKSQDELLRRIIKALKNVAQEVK
ncbi:MAG: hypothetical protein HYT79_03110 [Elusimicrobia bacterium]|nr:hypothetical protein [Elusimicrobiota bacterium]